MRQEKSIYPRVILVTLIVTAAVICLYIFGRRDRYAAADQDSIIKDSTVEASAASASAVLTQSPEPSKAALHPHSTTAAPESSSITPSAAAVETDREKANVTEVPETDTPTPEPPEILESLEGLSAGMPVEEDRIDAGDLSRYFTSSEISDEIFERIYGENRSYKPWCTVPREDLRYVTVLHRGYDGNSYVGEIMVNALLADEITEIFLELYENDYQIERMLLVDEFDADDDLSIANNNTSAFNYRPVTGGSTPSNHAYGCAIDINPLNNPYIEFDAAGNMIWYDVDVDLYLDRDAPDAHERHMIGHEDLCYQIFTARGWDWGGDWTNPVDYQHFEKPVYP